MNEHLIVKEVPTEERNVTVDYNDAFLSIRIMQLLLGFIIIRIVQPEDSMSQIY